MESRTDWAPTKGCTLALTARARGEQRDPSVRQRDNEMIDRQYVMQLRGRQKLYVRLLISCIALLPIGVLGMISAPGQATQWFAALPEVGLMLILALMFPCYRFAASPCPRCGRPLHLPGGFIKNVFCSGRLSDKNCIHCEFSLLTENEGRIVEPNIGQVSPEAAQSAPPDEPSM
jgi:hypothetical protein